MPNHNLLTAIEAHDSRAAKPTRREQFRQPYISQQQDLLTSCALCNRGSAIDGRRARWRDTRRLASWFHIRDTNRLVSKEEHASAMVCYVASSRVRALWPEPKGAQKNVPRTVEIFPITRNPHEVPKGVILIKAHGQVRVIPRLRGRKRQHYRECLQQPVFWNDLRPTPRLDRKYEGHLRPIAVSTCSRTFGRGHIQGPSRREHLDYAQDLFFTQLPATNAREFIHY